jgi:two-component system sensor histidine kinase BarA
MGPSSVASLLGWAEVRLSMEAIRLAQRARLINGFWVMLVGLGVSMLAALSIGSALSRALSDLSAAVARYRDGDLSARVPQQSLAELDQLARGFNFMAAELAGSQHAMRQQVELATRDLGHSLRTLEERNRQLEQAREQALAANRAKDQFLARISHEMRTPLNAVVGFGRLLEREAQTEASRDYSQTLERASQQLLTVVDDILQYAKLHAGSLQIDSAPFDPWRCLEDVVAILAPEAAAKGIELALVVHSDVPERLRGDSNRIGQILLNLLNNAVKFTEQGHVFVEESYRSLARGDHGVGGELQVVVLDTGIGLTDEQKQRLFRPFEQADSAISRRYGGTGLGLVISKRLLELMNGRIEVRSQLGQGARFAFSLPCEVLSCQAWKQTPRSMAGRKMLLCDPAPIQVRALRSVLLSWGIEVFATSQVEHIQTMLLQAEHVGRRFDLLLLGLAVRGDTQAQIGPMVVELSGQFPGPVLLLANDYRWQLPPALQALGRVDWCAKPVRRARLLDLLRKLLGVAAVDPDQDLDAAPALAFDGVRVLVVDDNAFNRALMGELCKARGMEVVDSPSGQDALQWVERQTPELVFMDLHMPGMDGFEVARRLRARMPEGQCPCIIALSADAFVAEPEDDLAPLFDAFLLKPLSERLLDETLERLLSAQRSPAGARSSPAQRLAPQQSDLAGAGAGAGVQPMALDAHWQRRLETELLDQLVQLEAAIQGGERAAVRERVHDLKGLCDFFGLGRARQQLTELEQAAKSEPLALLQCKHRRLRARLTALIKAGPLTQ